MQNPKKYRKPLISPTPWHLTESDTLFGGLDLVDAKGVTIAREIVKRYHGLDNGVLASVAPELLSVVHAFVRTTDGSGCNQAILDMALEVLEKIENQ